MRLGASGGSNSAPNTTTTESGPQIPAAHFLLLLILLWAPFVRFVVIDHHYPLLRMEVMLVLGLLALVAGALSRTKACSSSLPYAAIVAGLLTIQIDREWESMESTSKLVPLGLFVLLTLIAWKIGAKFYLVLLASSGVFLGATVIQGALSSSNSLAIEYPTGGSVGEHPPRWIHLLLDEHLGPEAILPATTAERRFRDEIRDVYARYGFKLYGRVYSHYNETNDAIPNLLNFTRSTDRLAFVQGDKPPYRLMQNQYFHWLKREGYVVNAISSGYLDICDEQYIDVKRCKNYQFGELRSLSTLEIPVLSKLTVLLGGYGTRYHRYRRVLGTYEDVVQPRLAAMGLPAPVVPKDSFWTWKRLLPLSVSAWAALSDIWHDVLTLPPGHALFVHLLLPHDPFFLNQDCSIKQIQEATGSSLFVDRLDAFEEVGRTRQELNEDYANQGRCLYRKLEELFEGLQANGMLDDSIIIVHGDHGARLGHLSPIHQELDKANHQDFEDAFDTLFASRLPGESSGYDTRARSLPDVFFETLARAGTTPPPNQMVDERPFVFLMLEEGTRFSAVPYPPAALRLRSEIQ